MIEWLIVATVIAWQIWILHRLRRAEKRAEQAETFIEWIGPMELYATAGLASPNYSISYTPPAVGMRRRSWLP